MKKKIKDLTEEEVIKICDNHSCKRCPLFDYESCHCKTNLLELYGEEEIEVEDDEK